MASDTWGKCVESFEFRDYPQALTLIDSLIKQKPDCLTYQIRRARCLSALGKTDEALHLYDSLAKQYKGERASILPEKAVVLVQTQKVEEALKIIQSLDNENLHPNMRFITCKSLVLMANNRKNEALELLITSLSHATAEQKEDSLNNAFLIVELYNLAKRHDIALRLLDNLLEDYPMYGRFWLARAAYGITFNSDSVLVCLEKAEKCKDAPAIRGGILCLKVYYYTNITHDYSHAMECMHHLIKINCQLDDFSKGVYLTTLYFASKQFNQAALEIKKLDPMVKTEGQEYELLYCKLLFALANNDGNEIQQLLDKNEKVCQYDEKYNNGEMVNSFRIFSVAYRQPNDNELAQLVLTIYKKNSYALTREIPFSVIFYTVDWDRKI